MAYPPQKPTEAEKLGTLLGFVLILTFIAIIALLCVGAIVVVYRFIF